MQTEAGFCREAELFHSQIFLTRFGNYSKLQLPFETSQGKLNCKTTPKKN